MTEKNTIPKHSSRHFKLEWNCTFAELLTFFEQVCRVTSRAAYFRAQIGEIYLSVKGVENESNLYGEMLSDHETVEDVLHQWRKSIQILKTLSRRPNPENTWHGHWIDLRAVEFQKESVVGEDVEPVFCNALFK